MLTWLTRDSLTFSTDEAYAQSLFLPQIAAGAGLTVAQIRGLRGEALKNHVNK